MAGLRATFCPWFMTARIPDPGSVPLGKISEVPVSLYLHFPWCVRKCPYCDFNSHGLSSGDPGCLPEGAYISALLSDLDYELREHPEHRSLTSIFMGGGTPSLFSDRAIGRLLEGVAKRMSVPVDIEITLEANPGTADADHFRGYRAAGVNRLSLGVQSFNDVHLRRLGRIHGSKEALRAVAMARDSGYDNINLDLMFSLPGQSVEEAISDLQRALSLAPEHLSWYQLTVEPKTAFAARPPLLPDDDIAWTIQETGQQILFSSGYCQYEVSAYARKDRCCRHNLNYWRFGDYLGIGAGAHGKRSAVNGVWRHDRHAGPRRFMAAAGTEKAIRESHPVAAEDFPFEYAMNALRLTQPFTLDDYERVTGQSRDGLLAAIARGRRRGLLENQEHYIQPTPLGRAHLNSLLEEFLPIATRSAQNAVSGDSAG